MDRAKKKDLLFLLARMKQSAKDLTDRSIKYLRLRAATKTGTARPMNNITWQNSILGRLNFCYRYAAFRVPEMFGFDFLIPT